MWDVLQEAAAHWSSRTCQLSAEFQLCSPKCKGWEKCSIGFLTGIGFIHSNPDSALLLWDENQQKRCEQPHSVPCASAASRHGWWELGRAKQVEKWKTAHGNLHWKGLVAWQGEGWLAKAEHFSKISLRSGSKRVVAALEGLWGRALLWGCKSQSSLITVQADKLQAQPQAPCKV